jgi:hypothetical protein
LVFPFISGSADINASFLFPFFDFNSTTFRLAMFAARGIPNSFVFPVPLSASGGIAI